MTSSYLVQFRKLNSNSDPFAKQKHLLFECLLMHMFHRPDFSLPTLDIVSSLVSILSKDDQGSEIALCTGRLSSVFITFSSSLAAVCPRWGQIHFWPQREQTGLWGFDNRPSADRCYNPGVPVAAYLRVWTRREDTDFLPRCQGQELCHRVLQHSHTRPNQVFSFQRSALLSHGFSSSFVAVLFLISWPFYPL